ncbi:hypothetical protein B0H94_101171 [Salsuginibacillus halophilus]|uniref:AAA domain-containing protein n=1 Tax=Salsuginibacillus halophilus TaxID=517424 RepID=A0A2P8HYF5_9BACI|nr:ATPase [Salsuginibacillus halophilus]PSL51261.1 hypothetical protein B0H94_101171 [Salsuginibacillus halophilus]
MSREALFQSTATALKEKEEEWIALNAQKEKLKEEQTYYRERLTVLEQDQELYDHVGGLLHETAKHARDQAKQQMETLVTNALQYVFGPMFSFQIELESSGGRAQAEFYVVSEMNGTMIKTKPAEARGGGVVDIVALALRMAMLETLPTGKGEAIVLDEPGKHVSEEYHHLLYEFLHSVAGMFNRQIVMVTHHRHLAESADNAYIFEIKDGTTEAVRPEHS